jgi:hypothetical protein
MNFSFKDISQKNLLIFKITSVLFFSSCISALIAFLYYKLGLAKYLEFHFHRNLLGYPIHFPCLSDSFIVSVAMFSWMFFCWLICAQLYHEYKAKTLGISKEKINWKKFLFLSSISFFLGCMILLIEEVVVSLNQALPAGFNLFFLFSGLLIIALVFIKNIIGNLDYQIKVNELALSKQQDNKNEKFDWIRWFKKCCCFLVQALLIIGVSFVSGLAFSRLEFLDFSLTASVCGSDITFFTNSGNTFALIFISYFFTYLTINFIAEYIDNDDEVSKQEKSKSNFSIIANIVKNSLIFGFIESVVCDVLISIQNSMQKFKDQFLPYFIGFVAIFAINCLSVYFSTRQIDTNQIYLEAITQKDQQVKESL